MRDPTIDDIRSLGFEWPKYPLLEQYSVIDQSQVDLARTMARLLQARVELSELPENQAKPASQCDQAIAYLKEIQTAAEKHLRGPEDFLRSLWPGLGVTRAVFIGDLTKAETATLLESTAMRCAETEFTYTQLRWVSRAEVEAKIQPHLEEPRCFPAYGYRASEWHTDENETIVVFCLCYWPI